MRISLFLFAVLLAAPASLAQPSFGIKAGLNVADLVVDDELLDDGGEFGTVDKQPRLGIVGGLTADLPFTPVLGVRAEVLYAQKGLVQEYNFDEGPDGEPFSGKQIIQLDYLEIPILARYSIPLQDGLEVGLLAGPVPAFLLSEGFACGGDYNDFEIFDDFCDDPDVFEDDDTFESFDLGGALGLTVGAGPFSVDARYTRGFMDVINRDLFDDPDITDDQMDTRNSVFSITAAYRFGR